MSFSRSQQGHYRPLVKDAFAASKLPADQFDAWYRRELLACVGVASTSILDKGRDFDVAMAHFEDLADAGTYWQQRAETGDWRRICHAVFGGNTWAIDGQPVSAEYLRGIAKQALSLAHLPSLRGLSKADLKVVIRALDIHRRRSAKC